MGADQSPNLDYKEQEDCHDLDHIPGEYGAIPYLGKTIELVNDLYGFIDKTYHKFGEVSKIKIGGQPGLLVVGAENYKTIYLDRNKAFSAQMGYEKSLANFYRKALLLRDFDDHKFQRRMFQTAFKNDQMRGYVDIMNPLLKNNLDNWENQKDFLFFPAVKKALLDVGATVFIGVEEIGPEMDKINEAFLNISEKGLMGLFKVDMPGFKFHKGKQGSRYLEEYFTRVIPERRSGDGKDMLTHMAKETMDNGEFFPNEDLIPQASFLLFAAHDTTTSTLNHIILHLAQEPEWQDKLREEAQALGRDQLTYEDLDNLELMELVFKETLRMHPSVSMMQRRTIKEVELGGHKVPPNTIIFVPPVYNHCMEEFWTEPFKFDPMRFAPGREEQKNHSFCYMPFGGGAHKCIGMHFANMIVKCFLHQFLLKYKWSVPADYNPKMEAFPLPKTADGLPIKLEAIS
ncbi:Putative cytochrome P450 136 [BD1-7 clade bacterium]|uniref:Cytochrome P450 136 n=1 Tax=BD1-7 clade bacterium TaxID=2029982 RepID=A0A5S9MWB4_9GAMM|nr:Putative cytochrome P450 136 [BD1-7 clade bacterium]CAA0084417.1 Putative cytochrome P450 136 [BD1-7 clade bacterium]